MLLFLEHNTTTKPYQPYNSQAHQNSRMFVQKMLTSHVILKVLHYNSLLAINQPDIKPSKRPGCRPCPSVRGNVVQCLNCAKPAALSGGKRSVIRLSGRPITSWQPSVTWGRKTWTKQRLETWNRVGKIDCGKMGKNVYIYI